MNNFYDVHFGALSTTRRGYRTHGWPNSKGGCKGLARQAPEEAL